MDSGRFAHGELNQSDGTTIGNVNKCSDYFSVLGLFWLNSDTDEYTPSHKYFFHTFVLIIIPYQSQTRVHPCWSK